VSRLADFRDLMFFGKAILHRGNFLVETDAQQCETAGPSDNWPFFDTKSEVCAGAETGHK
jgi:hypothetical protein